MWWKVKPAGTQSAFGAHYTTRSDGSEELHFDYYERRQSAKYVSLSEGSIKSVLNAAGQTTFSLSPFKDVAVVPTSPSTTQIQIGSPDSRGEVPVMTDGPCLLFGYNSGSDFQTPLPKREKKRS